MEKRATSKSPKMLNAVLVWQPKWTTLSVGAFFGVLCSLTNGGTGLRKENY